MTIPAIGLKDAKDAVDVFEQYIDAVSGTSLANVMSIYAKLPDDVSAKVRLIKAVRLANTEARYIELSQRVDAAQKVIEQDGPELLRMRESMRYYGMVDSANEIPY